MPTPAQRPNRGATTLCLLIPTLLQMVHAKFCWLHEEEVEDAVLAAIEHQLEQDKDLLKDVDKEIDEGTLRCLYVSACNFASNTQRAERRRSQREEKYACRKKIEIITKNSVKKAASAEVLGIDMEGVTRQAALESLLAHLSKQERDFVDLRRQGVEDIHAYAELLGFAESSTEEQEQAVEREWHRLQMKLRRLKSQYFLP